MCMQKFMPAAVLLAVTVMACSAQHDPPSGTDYDAYTGFACDPTPVLPEQEVHPSLWFKEADVPRLRALKDQDDLAAGLWKKIEASPFLTMEFLEVPAASDEKKVIHQYYGYMSKIAKFAGFMAWMTEDTELRNRYVKRAADALERAYDGPIMELDPIIKGSPVDEIYMGTWLQNYAAAYDWVQPFLTPEQDERIRARLAKENHRVAVNLINWAPEPHNHLSKPAWGVGSMALALSSEPNASEWLAAALKAGNANTRYFFSEDGIYREGSHYLIFSWINFLPFMHHYYNVSGVDQFEQYQPVMEWGVAVRNGKGWLPNIEDSYIRPFPGHMAAKRYTDRSTWLHSFASLAEVMTWAYKTTDLSVFNAYLDKTGFNYSGATWDYTLELDEYLTYDPTIASVAPDASPTVFLKGGQSIFRNTWTSSDPSQRYLLFQGVAEADNHQHADHLSFILFAENQMMASDGGYTRGSYRDSLRTSWYNQAVAHNVITLDGEAPVDVKESETPLSRYRFDTDFFDFEEKESPFPNGGTLRRAVAFPGESYFIVADIITSPAEAEAVLYLHGGRGTMSGENPYRVWSFSDDAYGPAAKLHTWTLGADRIENAEGESTYLKQDYGVFPYIKASTMGKEAVFMQILVPGAPDQEPPSLAYEVNSGQIGSTISGNSWSDMVIMNPCSDNAEYQGLETDGTFCWIRLVGDKVAHMAVREATYVKMAGSLLFEASTPESKVIDLTEK